MQAAVSKHCEATVGGFNNTQSAAGGVVANMAYGSCEIVMFMNRNQSADVPMECIYGTIWLIGFFP